MAIEDVLQCVAPEFDAIAPNIITCIKGLALNEVDELTFDKDYEAAVAYLMAHILAIREYRKGNSGSFVTQLREGDLQKSFATPESLDTTSLSDTAYGREFLRLRGLHVIGAICVS